MKARMTFCKNTSTSKQPEVITIPDSDEEESQDLFDSVSDEVVLVDSDDLFSCSGSEFDSPEKKLLVSSLPCSKGEVPRKDKQLHSSYPRNKGKRSSSVVLSPWKNPSSRMTWRKSTSSEHIARKNPPVITIENVIAAKKVKIEESIKKQKSDPWASTRMKQIAQKFEKRGRIMNDLVESDKDFLSIVRGGALDLIQKKAKEELIEGDVVRKQADRAKMRGVVHPSAEAYFDALELSPASKERRVNEVSRVRVVAQKMPSTPENYWEIGFPSESEQRRRGLIKEVHIPRKCIKNLFQEQSE